MQLDVLVRTVPETVINIVVAYGSSRAEGYSFPFFRSQRIGMMVEFGNCQRTVQNHIVDGIPQIAKAAAQAGNQFVMNDDAPVFIAFCLGGFAYRMPEGKYFIGINHQFV